MSNPKIYSYPDFFISEDWGSISLSSIESVDFGPISTPYETNENYGSITVLSTPPFGSADVEGKLAESRTYDYNILSVVPDQEPEDYGSIESSVTEISDYGVVGAALTEGITSYGSIVISGGELPYGTIEVSGSAEISAQVLNIHFGSGTITISGEATDEQYVASDVGIGTFSALGGSAEVSGSNPPDQTVDITISGSKIESRSYAYNEDSVIIFEGYEDYGLITDSVTYDDYGFISSEVGYEGYVDFGFIVTNETTLPYGTVVISGESESKFISQGGEQTLLFNITGVAVESYQTNPPDQTVLFEISGNSVEVGIFQEIGLGLFSAFGDKLESVTYDYNENSIVIYEEPEDYGSIESSVSEILDYGIVGAGISGIDNYGSIINLSNVVPYGTIEISGSAFIEIQILNIQIGSGTINVSGEATNEQYVASDVGIGTAVISGESGETSTDSYVGSGLFSAFGDKIESRSYAYNEDSVFIIDPYEDYGLITDAVTYEDYGLITDSVNYEDYGSVEPPYSESVYPYGTIEISGESESKFISQGGEQTLLFNISGTAVEKNTESDVGIGTFSALGGSADILIVNPPDQTVDITISGSKIESRSYAYSEDSINVFEGYEDYGLITDSVTYDDYGFISTEVGYEGYDDFGFIVTNETTLPYGTIEISGSAFVEIQILNIQIGSGTINISGEATNEQYVASNVGIGTFSALGGSAEVFGANPPDQTVDIDIFGNAPERSTYAEIGFGSFSISGESKESFSPSPLEQTLLFNITGTAVEKNTESDVGVGTFSALGGSAEVFGANPPDQTVDIIISGSKIESRSYAYNEDSAFLIDPYEDYGLITDSVTYDDYGSITDLVSYEDYGSVEPPYSESVYPYGTIEISGESQTFIEIENIHIGLGTIFVSGTAVESYQPNPPDQTVLFEISGDSLNSASFPETGSGLFSTFGDKLESVTYDYNENSIVIYEEPEDYGSIGSAVTSISDYGVVGAGISGIDNYGSIINLSNVVPYGTIEISGSAFVEIQILNIQIGSGTINISGEATNEQYVASNVGVVTSIISGESGETSTDSYVGSGLFSAFGDKLESVTYDYNEDSINVFEGYEDYGLITDEVTYEDYGLIITPIGYEGYDDFGFIISNETIIPYGTIEISGESESKFISQGGEQTLLFNISGTAVEKNTESDVGIGTVVISGEITETSIISYIGSGFFSAFGDKIESRSYAYNEDSVYIEISGESESKFISQGGEQTLLFNITGVAVEKNTESDVGVGTFSALGGAADILIVNPPDQTVDITISGSKIESRSYAYNEDSAFIIDPYEDYGLITDIVTYDDYGSITDSVTYEDYGSVEPPYSESVYPYGTIDISGTARIILDIANIHIGLGTIFVSGTAVESYQPNPPDQTVLFDISGDSLNSGLFPEIGSGLFSAFGEKVESRSYSYNIDSGIIYEEPEDYGSIGSAVTSIVDYGVVGAGISGINDYGSILTSSTTRSFGTIEISGAATNTQITPAYNGSGTISAVSGAADVLGVNPPDQTVLITISGDADTAVSALYVYEGFTDIEISGESENDVDFVYTYSGSGISTVSGAATDERVIFAHEGTGTISAVSGAADVLGVNPPDQTVLITISGDADTDVDFVYTYSGSGIVTISGAATDEKFVASNVGIGTIEISGAARIFSDIPSPTGGTIEIFGSADDSVTPATAIGSGLIDIDGEGAESITYVYDENSINAYFVIDYGFISDVAEYEDLTFLTDIIRIYEDYGTIEFGDQSVFPYGTIEIFGESDNREIAVYTYSGIGIVDISGESSDIQKISSYSGSGQIIVSGTVDDNYIPSSYLGFGTIFAIGGSAEVYGPNPPDNTVLFNITGAADTRFEYEYSYSGSGIATFFGESENRIISSFSYNGLTDIEISGGIRTDIGIYVPSITGVGIVTISGSAIDVYGPNPQEDTVLFDITGIGSESFSYANYDGTGNITIDGVGIAISNPFRAPFVFVTII
jgi:hypothetical protein